MLRLWSRLYPEIAFSLWASAYRDPTTAGTPLKSNPARYVAL
jgi:hypothetical protein